LTRRRYSVGGGFCWRCAPGYGYTMLRGQIVYGMSFDICGLPDAATALVPGTTETLAHWIDFTTGTWPSVEWPQTPDARPGSNPRARPSQRRPHVPSQQLSTHRIHQRPAGTSGYALESSRNLVILRKAAGSSLIGGLLLSQRKTYYEYFMLRYDCTISPEIACACGRCAQSIREWRCVARSGCRLRAATQTP
jgi:hypothetical protein